ncbi:hypothetical protein AN958_02923 [Leucoagaricus sp. SymC.cos]|nr:hypothetical protein AN958_02923 [Leucoagaricus sp. SymC.cos]
MPRPKFYLTPRLWMSAELTVLRSFSSRMMDAITVNQRGLHWVLLSKQSTRELVLNGIKSVFEERYAFFTNKYGSIPELYIITPCGKSRNPRLPVKKQPQGHDALLIRSQSMTLSNSELAKVQHVAFVVKHFIEIEFTAGAIWLRNLAPKERDVIILSILENKTFWLAVEFLTSYKARARFSSLPAQPGSTELPIIVD